jgi:cell wall-associated NlpC family hydrolase
MLDFMQTRYKDLATGPLEYDCGGFVRDVGVEILGLDIPSFQEVGERCWEAMEDIKNLSFIMRSFGFSPIDGEPKTGDIVAISRFNNGLIDHIGIMLNGFQFAQMTRKGPEVTSISSVPYRRRIKGYYRCKT